MYFGYYGLGGYPFGRRRYGYGFGYAPGCGRCRSYGYPGYYNGYRYPYFRGYSRRFR